METDHRVANFDKKNSGAFELLFEIVRRIYKQKVIVAGVVVVVVWA